MTHEQVVSYVASQFGIPQEALELTPIIVDGRLEFNFGVFPDKMNPEEVSDLFRDIMEKLQEDELAEEDLEEGEDVPQIESPLNLNDIFPGGISLDNNGDYCIGQQGTALEGVEEWLEALEGLCASNPIALGIIQELTEALL